MHGSAERAALHLIVVTPALRPSRISSHLVNSFGFDPRLPLQIQTTFGCFPTLKTGRAILSEFDSLLGRSWRF